MARLDRFMPVKEIAQIGAAIGREFSYELIAAVAPIPEARLDDALTQLTASGLAFRRGTPPDAIYTFKHALVQDAAYDSSLKSRRQDLHAKIARVIEARFPNTKTTEPEVLAHHLTAAGLPEAAIPLWRTACELALKRSAFTEAISHLNHGLELVFTLPQSSERDAIELGLRSHLGTAWYFFSPASQERWAILYPALALAKSLGRNDARIQILGGLFGIVWTHGRVSEFLPWAMEMLDLAKVTGDIDQLAMGYNNVCVSYCFAGEFIKAVEHADWALGLDDDNHGHRAQQVSAGTFGSICTWILGYPDRALRLSNKTNARARRLAHPFTLGYTLMTGVHEYDHRFGHEDLRRRAEECERLGRENGLPFLWAFLAQVGYGRALIREGKPVEGIAPLKAGVAWWEASGGKVRNPTFKAFLAEALALTGDIDNALHLLDEQMTQIERPGWEERFFYAEILRLKGWMLSVQGDLEGAERNFLASLDWSRRQQAKMWELRTSTSLARLWQSQGKRRDAHELLAPVYGWFTEGFDTEDLLEAKALLDEFRS